MTEKEAIRLAHILGMSVNFEGEKVIVRNDEGYRTFDSRDEFIYYMIYIDEVENSATKFEFDKNPYVEWNGEYWVPSSYSGKRMNELLDEGKKIHDMKKELKRRGFSNKKITATIHTLQREAKKHTENNDSTLESSNVSDDKTYVRCNNCGYYEEVNKKLFVKILGGAATGFGFWAWTSFFFAGCGFALPLCIAIMAGGVAIATHAKEVGDWLSKKYSCPNCSCKNWAVLTGKELRLQGEVDSLDKLEGVYDAEEIIPVMEKIYSEAEKFIYISYGWYTKSNIKRDLKLMKKAIERRVHIYFYFGIKPLPGYKDRNPQTAEAIQFLRDNLDREYAHFKAVDTHTKIILCDKYIISGSQNLLSYRVWENAAARGELTEKLQGRNAVNLWLNKVTSQPEYPEFEKYFDKL